MIDDKKFKNLKKQLSLICDNNGVIRLKGRLDNSFMSYDSKHPILLDRNSHATKLKLNQVFGNSVSQVVVTLW